MAAGLKNVGAAVGGALKTVGSAMLTPFKALGGLFGRKKKKKGNPELKSISDALKRIEDVISRVEEVFADYIGYLAKNFKKLLDKVKSVFVKWWLGVLIEIIVPTLVIIGALLYLLADPLMKILQPVMDFIENIVGKILDFVAPIRDFLLTVLKGTWDIIKAPFEGFFRGIGKVAESLGAAIGKLVIGIADFTVDVLMPFLRDVVLPVLGSILNVVKLFFDGFSSIAAEVGKAFGELVVAIAKVAKQIVDFATEVVGLLTDIVKIVRKPIQMLADFFDGLGSKAKEIGAKVGEVVLVALDIIKGILEKIRDNMDGLINLVRLYVVAPIQGIQRKMRGLMVELAEKFSFKIPVIRWVGLSKGGLECKLEEVHPFKFLTGGMTEEQKAEALADADKSVSELIGDEMGKMQQKIDAENKAKELDELNRKVQQQKMQTFLENLNVVDDIYRLVKDIHTHLLGEKKTAETLAAKAAIPAFKKLESIKEQQAQQQEGLGDQLEAQKAEAAGEAEASAGRGPDLFGFLEKKFAAVMEKLDNPAVIPMPLPDRTVNYAGMEDA